MDEFSIYVLGDADSYFFVFNSIAALIQSNYIEFAIAMALMVATIRSGLAFSKADPKTGVYSIMLMIGLFSAALYPTTTAHIIDVRQQGQNKTYTKIDNLPFALTFLASSVSTVLVPVAEITEVAFSNTENSATKVGLGKQPEMISNFMKVSNFINQESANYPLSFFKNAFKIYTKECAMSTSHIPDVGLDYFIKPSQDIVDHINPITLGIPSSAYTNTTFSDGTVTIQKCNDLYNYIVDKRASIENLIEKKFSEINSDIDYEAHKEEIAKGLYEAGIRVGDITSTLGTYSENLKISMLNYALSQTLEETITDYKYDLPGISGDLIDYSVNKSSYQMQTDGLGSWAWTNKMAPLVIHYMLIFSYALFLFVIPVAMGMGFENSKKMLINYSMGIIAIHLGYLSSTVANSIALYYMEKSATNLIFELGNNLMAMNSIPAFNANASEMAAISGILLISSYTLGTGIILKGETAAMQGIMNTIGSRFKNDMLNAAQDMSSKNAYDEVDQKAKTDARRFLGQNGFKAPIGVDEVAYANEIKRGLETMGGGYGFASASQGSSSFESDYMSGISNKSAAAAVGTATVGSRVSTTEAIDSGIATGNLEAGKMSGLASSLKQIGGNALFDASRTGTIAQNKDQVANASALSSKFGKDLDGTSNGLSYEEMASAESNSKLAGRIGGSKGYLNLGKDAFDMTAENAEYMAESKAKGTQKRLDTLGGIDGAVATDVANAMLKATSEKLDIAAKKDAGILNSSNELTKDGLSAMAIKPGQDANTMMSQNAIGKNAPELFKKIAEEQGLTEAQAKEKFAPFMNGENFKSGQDFWNAVASQKAGVFSGHNSIMFGDGSMFSGGFDKSGALMGKFSSGISSIDDNSNTKTDLNSTVTGSKSDLYNDQTNIHNTDAKTQNQLENTNGNKNAAANRLVTRDRLQYEADPRNQALDATTDLIHMALPNENQEDGAIAAGAIGTGVGIALGTTMLEKATKDNNGRGVVKKSYNWTRDKFDTLVGGEPSSQSTNDSNNSTSNYSNSQSNSSTDDKTSHNDSLRNYGNAEAHNESITKNNIDGNSKGGWFSQRIDAFADAMTGKGGMGAKIGMGISALAFGSQNETFANALTAMDPSSYIMGQPMGNGMITSQNMQSLSTMPNNLQPLNDPGLIAAFNNLQAMPIANAVNSSGLSTPTASALFSSGNMSIDNPMVSNIERSISQDAQYAQSSKEANIELIDQMTTLADAIKENTNKERR